MLWQSGKSYSVTFSILNNIASLDKPKCVDVCMKSMSRILTPAKSITEFTLSQEIFNCLPAQRGLI